MTDPVERERKKYRVQQMVRQWATARKLAIWLPIGVFVALFAATLIWGK
jgi:hypothetical protein